MNATTQGATGGRGDGATRRGEDPGTRRIDVAFISRAAMILLLLAATAPTFAQQIGNPTTQDGVNPARGTYAIRNAHIVTVSGAELENGTVLVRDGKIAAVGTNVDVPPGAQSI